MRGHFCRSSALGASPVPAPESQVRAGGGSFVQGTVDVSKSRVLQQNGTQH